MKVCCVRGKRAKKFRNAKIGLICLLAGILAIVLCVESYARAVLKGYPMAVATGIVQELMDGAMETVLSSEDTPDISQIDNIIYDENNNVRSIETDTKSLNIVKTAFVSKLKNVFKDYGNNIKVKVPIGTLIGNEYTLGRGPEITFKLQFSTTVTTSLESDFSEAGINNTQHTVYLNVICDLFVIIPFGSTSKQVETNYILSQTVFSGDVPDAYTNVFDGYGDITEDLFNYGAELD